MIQDTKSVNPEITHRIYIASSLENWEKVRYLWGYLAQMGVGPTYDWTPHGERIFGGGTDILPGSIPSDNELGEIGWGELKGVLEAEYLLVVLPGERGTHVELGAYYSLHTDVGMIETSLPDTELLQSESCRASVFKPVFVPPTSAPITILMGNDTAKRPTSFHYMKGIKRTTSETDAIDHIMNHLNAKLE